MTQLPAVQNSFELQQRQAKALYASKYFSDAQSEAQAIVKVMAGAELGLQPFAAMTGIHIIKGKPVLGANLIATLVDSHPRYDYMVKQSDTDRCVIAWVRDGRDVGESSFTIEEAKTAGLYRAGGNWQKYPSDMLFARALTRGARRFAPGIFGGAPIYTPDELGAESDNEGYTIVETVTEAPTSEDVQVMQDVTDALAVDGVVVELNPEVVLITEGQMKRLHSVGKNFYGDEWETKRPDLVDAVSKGAVTSSSQLTTNEAKKLIDGIEAKIAKRDAEPQPEMSFVEHAAATEQSAYSEG